VVAPCERVREVAALTRLVTDALSGHGTTALRSESVARRISIVAKKEPT
jgi:hypothetical protein